MSIAVAVKKGKTIVLAADSQTTFGSTRVPAGNHKIAKIRRVGPAFLATTGWGLYENILDDYLGAKKAPSLADRKSAFAFFLGLWKELHQKYPFVNDQCDDKNSPFGDLDATFLIANRGGILHVASDLSITEFDKYHAIGSGTDFSLGVLYALYDQVSDPEKLARKSVEAAMAFNVYCGGQIQVERLAVR